MCRRLILISLPSLEYVAVMLARFPVANDGNATGEEVEADAAYLATPWDAADPEALPIPSDAMVQECKMKMRWRWSMVDGRLVMRMRMRRRIE